MWFDTNRRKEARMAERINERELQHQCVEWFRCNHPDCVLFSVPNEAAHKRINWFTYTGLLRGAADLVLVLPGKVVFVEMKTRYGRQSDEQVEFERKCNELGVVYVLCRNLEQFIEAVESHLK